MCRVAFQCRVQDADVEPARQRGGVAGKKVVLRRRHTETLPVQHDPVGIQPEARCLAGGKNVDVFREFERFGDLAFGVVITVEQIDGDARLPQAAHLAHEEQACVEVAPVAVVDVACDDHEVDGFVDGQIYQSFKGFPGGRA